MVEHEQLKLIPNKYKYYEFIRQLRNDPRVKSGFIKTEYITPLQQEIYMQKYASFYYICLYKEEPVGYVGVVDNEIRIATHPDYQNLGIAKFMILEIRKEYPTAFAKIKIENEASLKAFTRAGFVIKYYLLEQQDNE
jgi:RimJ/RimL family protein N-acetyltransferase